MEYSGNSTKSKQALAEREREKPEKKKVEKVIKGKTVEKKRSIARKFFDIFLCRDVDDVSDYIKNDVIIPAIQRTITDTICNAAEMLFGGRSRNRSDRNETMNYTKYSRSSLYGRDGDYDRRPSRSSDRYFYDDVILETLGDAKEVLDRVIDICDKYERVSVADLCDLVGRASNYTDNKYGWVDKDMANASIIGTRDGYLLKLPRPHLID